MIIKSFILPPIENNNYLIIDEISREAALVDCSSFDESIQLELKKQNANLKYVFLTHGHFDHIGGLNDLPPSVKVLMHSSDMEWVKEVNTYLPMLGMPSMEIPKIDEFIKDGDIINLGSLEIKVIHTPGHTQGGVCFYVDGNLFSGDTIFRESVGRCDLPGGNFNQIVESIENRIFTLPEETVIYPGHGRTTTVAWEKKHNSYM
ncbi:MBL fold metallo-hydrolase [bacterium]|nr:MBL fold metallo-hydrolase [bacterium]